MTAPIPLFDGQNDFPGPEDRHTNPAGCKGPMMKDVR